MSFASVDGSCLRRERAGSSLSDASFVCDDLEQRAAAAREFAELAFAALSLGQLAGESLAQPAASSPPVDEVPLKSRAKQLVKRLKRKSGTASEPTSGDSTCCSSGAAASQSPGGSPS